MRLGTLYRHKLLSHFNIFSGIGKKDKILDVGGFDGFILSTMKSDSKTVIDPDVDKKFNNVNYIKDNFFSHTFTSDYFDYIFSFDVLEHLPPDTEKQFIKKINSLLKNKGVIYLSTPSKNIKLFPSFLTKWVSKKWGHSKCIGYTKEELLELFNLKNLDIEIIEMNSRFYLTSYLFLRMINQYVPALLMDKILSAIAFIDARNAMGNNGFYLVIAKRITCQ